MDNILGFYIFDPSRGWLQSDEKTWAFDFHGGAEISSDELANAIGARESPRPDQTYYVFACLGSM